MAYVFGAILTTLFLPNPVSAKTHFEKAQELYEAGLETEARRALRQELTLRPDNLEARYDLAVLLEHIGHTDEAESTYLENMKRGFHLPTMINLSVIYARKNRRNEARNLLKRAARHFRSEATPLYMLAQMAEEDGHVQLATTYYGKALKADPLNGFAHVRFARFLSAQEKPSLASKHARRATRLLPGCGPCWRILGDILWKNGDLKKALAAYQKSSAILPAREVRSRMIKLLDAMGETQRARAMEHILELEP